MLDSVQLMLMKSLTDQLLCECRVLRVQLIHPPDNYYRIPGV